MTRLATYYNALALWALRNFSLLRSRVTAAHPGQGLVEYALILVLIAVTCIGIMSVMGSNLSSIWYDQIIGAFPS